jgi:hypothetical protein
VFLFRRSIGTKKLKAKITGRMKIKFLLILVIGFMGQVNAQLEYPKAVYTAKEMNITGKVKQATEVRVTLDKNGKVIQDEGTYRREYYFDEAQNITDNALISVQGSTKIFKTYSLCEYKDGKLEVETFEKENKDPYVKLFSYSPGFVIVKEKGKEDLVREKWTISDGRVTEIEYSRYFPDGKRAEGSIEKFEYNASGQIIKKTKISDPGTKWEHTSYDKYLYNQKGDISTWERYGEDNDKLVTTHLFEYTYDSNNNWTKCIWSSSGWDTKYQLTRTYLFY